jgi:hypothetical protein
MSVPLSDTARAIQVLDQRYGKDGWRVRAAPRCSFVEIPSERVARTLFVARTARDAIRAAAGRVRAETREIAA